MEDSKAWYASKGIWGSVVAIGAGIAGTIWGVSVTEADQTTIVSAITAVGGAVGGLIALWGRLKASKKVG
jgi:hypothetical protein